MIIRGYKNILPDLYSLHNEEHPYKVKNVEFTFTGTFDRSWFDEYCSVAVINFNSKMSYLKSRYHPVIKGDSLIFEKGCFLDFTDGVLTFRDKSEWWRKMPTDLLFIQDLTGERKFKVRVPVLWLRQGEIPLMCLNKYLLAAPLLEPHKKWRDALLKTYPLDEVLLMGHAISRRYFLRYYYRTGAITYNQYKRHRNKTQNDMIKDPSLRKL